MPLVLELPQLLAPDLPTNCFLVSGLICPHPGSKQRMLRPVCFLTSSTT